MSHLKADIKKSSEMMELYNRFIWKSESSTLFQEVLRQADSQASISNFMTA